MDKRKLSATMMILEVVGFTAIPVWAAPPSASTPMPPTMIRLRRLQILDCHPYVYACIPSFRGALLPPSPSTE